ncbi:MAG: hypothetical protein COS84_10825 [Armatimonadetes bacterium CG07_land_8_20_14_0_80_40_9]|nr:MAG: hypothetical protein COS84_10825 [Armatimonadetes bacterium CG07_land_8_20_14_0_80_40_9]
MLKKKNPIIAAVLSFVFGPFGYLYIGWKYFIMAFVMFAVFIAVLILTNLDPAVLLPDTRRWLKFPLLMVLAWKAYTICSVRNALIDAKDENVNALNSFPIVAMAMSDLLVGIGMVYAAAIGIYVSVKMFLIGNLVKGFLYLIIGTPVLVWIASLAFGLIAMGIDALFAKGAENVFRKRYSA